MQKFMLENEVNIVKYYLNENLQPSYNGGNYEIHREICPYYYKYTSGGNFICLGTFYSEIDALNAARRQFPQVANKIDGCAYCCSIIHKG